MTKLIKVSDETHKKLFEMKKKDEFDSMEQLIDYLLHINEQYENSKVVRLIRVIE